MSREDKIKADKFALIYEFNRNSPLFSRVASRHLEEGEIEQALPILEEGIKKFPDYPTGIIIYALALSMSGKKDAAREKINKLKELGITEQTVNYYLNKIDNMPAMQAVSQEEVSADVSIITEETAENEIAEPGIDQAIEVEEDEAGEEEEMDDLEELAERLQKASIPVVNDASDNETEDEGHVEQYSGKSLVSETLAKIYFNQGNYQEALSIYETLIDIQPEKSAHYQKLIDQIKEKMGGK